MTLVANISICGSVVPSTEGKNPTVRRTDFSAPGGFTNQHAIDIESLLAALVSVNRSDMAPLDGGHVVLSSGPRRSLPGGVVSIEIEVCGGEFCELPSTIVFASLTYQHPVVKQREALGPQCDGEGVSWLVETESGFISTG